VPPCRPAGDGLSCRRTLRAFCLMSRAIRSSSWPRANRSERCFAA
jgi:hypothetical protein